MIPYIQTKTIKINLANAPLLLSLSTGPMLGVIYHPASGRCPGHIRAGAKESLTMDFSLYIR